MNETETGTSKLRFQIKVQNAGVCIEELHVHLNVRGRNRNKRSVVVAYDGSAILLVRLVSSLRETTTPAPERSLVNIKTCSLFRLFRPYPSKKRNSVAAFSISRRLSESIPLCPPAFQLPRQFQSTRAREKRRQRARVLFSGGKGARNTVNPMSAATTGNSLRRRCDAHAQFIVLRFVEIRDKNSAMYT